MRRVLAVLGALLMVAVAVLVRSIIDDGDDGGGASGPNGGDDVPTLMCAEELREVCETLEADGVAEVTIEPVGETVDRLGVLDAELEVDGWLTLDPFPAQVNERREFATGSALFGQPLATNRSSSLSIVAANDRAEALGSSCGEVDWACLGDAAGEPWTDLGGEPNWGDVRPGYDAPDTSATGLLVLAQAMASHLGDPAFAGQDIDRRWLGDLEDAVPTRTAGTALLKLVQQGGAAFAAVGALSIEAEAAAETPQGDDLTIFYPAPMFRASVVLAPGRGVDLGDLLDEDDFDDALDEAGWEADETGEPLPSAGVLDALRSAWENL